MQIVQDANLLIYEPGNDSKERSEADINVPSGDIASASVTRRITDRKDTADIELHNDDGRYTTNATTEINSGQRVVLYVSTGPDIKSWGDRSWGEGGWGGLRLVFTGMIRDVQYTYGGPNTSYVQLSIEDFVFAVMSKRRVYDSYVNKPIAGPSDAILNQALQDEASNIRRNKIADFSDRKTDYTADGTNLLELALSLARRGNAVMSSDRLGLMFKKISNIPLKFELKPDDVGFFSVKESDTNMVNEVRVDGGIDKAVDDQQTTQDGYLTATNSSRVKFQIQTRKSSIEELEIWTNKTGSGESVTVRLQKDEGGAPIAPTDNKSDIASKSKDASKLEDDGFTKFPFGNHTLPEPNPWVIVETDGGTGQDIGVNTQGTSSTSDDVPAFKAWYSYGITIRKTDVQSVDQYRRRETRIKDDSIRTPDEAREIAVEKIKHDSEPKKELQAPADSDRAHLLKLGDLIYTDFPREDAVGEYLITEITMDYQDNIFDMEFTASEVSSI